MNPGGDREARGVCVEPSVGEGPRTARIGHPNGVVTVEGLAASEHAGRWTIAALLAVMRPRGRVEMVADVGVVLDRFAEMPDAGKTTRPDLRGVVVRGRQPAPVHPDGRADLFRQHLRHLD